MLNMKLHVKYEKFFRRCCSVLRPIIAMRKVLLTFSHNAEGRLKQGYQPFEQACLSANSTDDEDDDGDVIMSYAVG